MRKKYQGVLIDNRKQKEKEKDYSHNEIVASSKADFWHTRAEAKKVEKLYEKLDQKTTSACGAYAGELALRTDTNIKGEPAYIYRLRSNYSGEGMFHYNLMDILCKNGVPPYQNIKPTEASYNAYKVGDGEYLSARKSMADSYVFYQDNDFNIDDIGYVLNVLKRPVILFVYWNGKEWSSDKPKASDKKLMPWEAQYRHFVTALPNSAYKYKNEKYFIIQDSAWFGGENIRHISEDWVNKRIYTGAYTLFLQKQTEQKWTKYVFTKDLTIGDRGDEVKMLQKILKQMGFFPQNIDCTGYFGGITRQAVKDFQQKYFSEILQILGLRKPTGYWGSSSRKKMNTLLK